MAVLPIRKYPDPVLQKPCHDVDSTDPALRDLAESMAETMYQADGIGLAAPQVGEGINLVVVDPNPKDRQGSPLILFNPRIVEKEGSQCNEEGCLSLPGHYSDVTRAARVVLEAMDREGREIHLEAQGIFARCLQHELDHLQGKLVLDYLSPLKRALYRKKRLKEIRRSGS